MSLIKNTTKLLGVLGATIIGIGLTASPAMAQVDWNNHSTSNNTNVVARHETGSVVHGNKLYVLGGRGNRPVQVFDATQNRWSTLAPLPMELHHFQPVVVNGGLFVIGAFTCCYPEETSVSDIYRLDLGSNNWEVVGNIPTNRLRGSAGTVVRNNKIYLVGGNTNGHAGGAVNWFDEYNPATNTWKVLPNAPKARDHFSAALVGNKLIAAAGRTTNKSFGGMVAATDSYNFNTNSWSSVKAIPTPRAGATIGVKNGNLIVIGGETDTQVIAHDEVEAFNVTDNTWRTLPALQVGRHGGASGVIGNKLHAITGNTYRGGGNEVTDHETLDVSDADNDGIFNFEDSTDNTNTGTGTGTDTGTGTGSNPNADSDNDGLTDQREAALQTNPQKSDTDGDSLKDGAEVNQHNTDPLKDDTDADGLSDGDEINRGTNPLNPDSDNDGLTDIEEIGYSTNPLSADSDVDGISDIDEIQTYLTNPSNSDSDGDTLKDLDELNIHFTDPLLADTDNDGLSDDAEVLTHNSNPNAWDTDGDGISDATEVAEGTNLINPDQDGDGIPNTIEGAGDADGDSIPNYLDLDSDNDSIADVVENGQIDSDNNGRVDSGQSNDSSAQPQNDQTTLFDLDNDGIANIYDLDSDQDGITDLAESGQSDPQNNGRLAMDQFIDANQDGWLDNAAIAQDTDQDTTPDYLDLDSDEDGVVDAVEFGGLDANNDGMLDNFSDTNLDGLHDEVTGIELTPIDSDNDGTSDTTDGEISPKQGGGGCTTGATNDPLLPMVMLTFLAVLAIRSRASISIKD